MKGGPAVGGAQEAQQTGLKTNPARVGVCLFWFAQPGRPGSQATHPNTDRQP